MLRTLRQRITFTDIFIWMIGLSIAGIVIWGTISYSGTRTVFR